MNPKVVWEVWIRPSYVSSEYGIRRYTYTDKAIAVQVVKDENERCQSRCVYTLHKRIVKR